MCAGEGDEGEGGVYWGSRFNAALSKSLAVRIQGEQGIISLQATLSVGRSR